LTSQQELEASLRLLVALVLGIVMGTEREYFRHPAGMRTITAVCVGSCLFTVAGSLVPHTDPTRVAAQIVTGIGFLGAGAILRSGRSIHGLTTAAAIWVAAAIGMAVGFRLFILAGLATLMVVAALVVLQYVEDLLVRVRERWSSPPT